MKYRVSNIWNDLNNKQRCHILMILFNNNRIAKTFGYSDFDQLPGEISSRISYFYDRKEYQPTKNEILKDKLSRLLNNI